MKIKIVPEIEKDCCTGCIYDVDDICEYPDRKVLKECMVSKIIYVEKTEGES